jgi:hypothetical protein
MLRYGYLSNCSTFFKHFRVNIRVGVHVDLKIAHIFQVHYLILYILEVWEKVCNISIIDVLAINLVHFFRKHGNIVSTFKLMHLSCLFVMALKLLATELVFLEVHLLLLLLFDILDDTIDRVR